MNKKNPNENKTITIFGLDDRDEVDSRQGMFNYLQELRYGRAKVKAQELEKRLREFLEVMQEVIQKTPERFGDYTLESVSFTAEISAKGTVSLLGTGGEMSGKSGITFLLKRAQLAAHSSPPQTK